MPRNSANQTQASASEPSDFVRLERSSSLAAPGQPLDNSAMNTKATTTVKTPQAYHTTDARPSAHPTARAPVTAKAKCDGGRRRTTDLTLPSSSFESELESCWDVDTEPIEIGGRRKERQRVKITQPGFSAWQMTSKAGRDSQSKQRCPEPKARDQKAIKFGICRSMPVFPINSVFHCSCFRIERCSLRTWGLWLLNEAKAEGRLLLPATSSPRGLGPSQTTLLCQGTWPGT